MKYAKLIMLFFLSLNLFVLKAMAIEYHPGFQHTKCARQLEPVSTWDYIWSAGMRAETRQHLENLSTNQPAAYNLLQAYYEEYKDQLNKAERKAIKKILKNTSAPSREYTSY